MSQRVNRYYLVSAVSQPEATRSSGLSFLPALPVEEGRHTQRKDKLSVTSQTVKFTHDGEGAGGRGSILEAFGGDSTGSTDSCTSSLETRGRGWLGGVQEAAGLLRKDQASFCISLSWKPNGMPQSLSSSLEPREIPYTVQRHNWPKLISF